MKKINAIFLVVVIILTILITTGCAYEYKGEYADLLSVSLANLPAARGCSPAGEIIYDPQILVLETDSEGRTLFYYYEDCDPYWHILIKQKSDGEKVYYYPDDCYLSLPISEEYIFSYDDEERKNMVYECISEEALSSFKALNDWDMPINEAKCESTNIITKKSEGKNNPGETKFNSYAEEYYKLSGRYIHPKNSDLVYFTSYLTCDNYGRELYIVKTYITDYDIKSETTTYYHLLIVITPNGSCDISSIISVDNPYDCRDAIKNVKLQNNWNNPIN